MPQSNENDGIFWVLAIATILGGGGAVAKVHLAPIIMIAVVIGIIFAIVYCVWKASRWLPEGVRGPAHAGFWLGMGLAFIGCTSSTHGHGLGEGLLMLGMSIAGALLLGGFAAISDWVSH